MSFQFNVPGEPLIVTAIALLRFFFKELFLRNDDVENSTGNLPGKKENKKLFNMFNEEEKGLFF